jgi:hypothetical protein
MEWQPIETMPRDGSRCLIAWDGTRTPYGGRLVQFGALHETIMITSDGEYGGGSLEEGTRRYPTHWMPLPAPPTSAETPQR